MFLSIDSRAFLLSKIRKFKNSDQQKINLISNFLGVGSGPQEFMCDLAAEIDRNSEIEITYNFLKSDLHLLNLGFHSKIWDLIQIKNSKNVVIRFDGIGIDSTSDKKRSKYKMENLIKRGKYLIFQSNFCRQFFKNEFGYLPNNSVINNGAKIKRSLIDSEKNQLKKILGKNFKNDYYVVAGRNVPRKRIKEIVNSFDKINKYKLIVLSEIPNNEKLKNKKIKYIGKLHPFFAREIISNSNALIHMDQYDWCPNIVISAIIDKVPIVCSNFGGTCEIVKDNGIIIEEFAKDLPSNLEAIKLIRSSLFPEELLYCALEKLSNKKKLENYPRKYLIESCA